MRRIVSVVTSAVVGGLFFTSCRDSVREQVEGSGPLPTSTPVGGPSRNGRNGLNPIQRENLLPGSPFWRDGSVGRRQVEMYLSTESQGAGGFISVKVSSDLPSRITAEIYRLGWYGGAGARLVWTPLRTMVCYKSYDDPDRENPTVHFSDPPDADTQYIRRIWPGGARAVETIAGSPWPSVGYEDGLGPVARFRAQMGMAITRSGEIYLADSGNFRIRKIVPGGSINATRVYTFAGTGRMGTDLGGGAVSDTVLPTGVAVLSDGRW